LRRRTLSAISGNAQTDAPGQTLKAELVVKVVDAHGYVKSGVEVTFQVTGGDGSLSVATATTDPGGLARSSWTIGPDEGLNTVEARIAPTPDAIVSGPVTFVALGRRPPRPPSPSPTPYKPGPYEPPQDTPDQTPQASGPALLSIAPAGSIDRAYTADWL